MTGEHAATVQPVATQSALTSSSSSSVITSRPTARQTAVDLLGDGIVISKFWKNRTRNEAVFVSLREFKGHALIDMRIFVGDEAGCARPSKKGLCLAVRRLPDLQRALAKAETKARDLGLLVEETS